MDTKKNSKNIYQKYDDYINHKLNSMGIPIFDKYHEFDKIFMPTFMHYFFNKNGII